MLPRNSSAWRAALILLVALSMLGALVLALQAAWGDALVAGLSGMGGWAAVALSSPVARAEPVRTGWVPMVIAAAAGVAVSLLWQPVPDRAPELVVVATGQKNPAARSAEVWLLGVGSASAGFDTDRFQAPDWERRERIVVSYRQQPNQARWSGSWPRDSVLRLNKHPHSGIALVRIGSSEQRLDLYSEVTAHVDVPLPAPRVSTLKRVIQGIVGVMAGLAGALLAVQGAVSSRLARGVVALAVLVGACTGLSLRDVPTSGSIELVVLHAGGAGQADASLDAGRGFLPRLQSPLVQANAAALVRVPASQALIAVQTSQEPSRIYRRADGAGASPSSAALVLDERTQAFMAEFPASTTPSARIALSGRTLALDAPSRDSAPAEPDRLFLVGVRDATGVRIGWTRTVLALPAWQAPTYAVRRVRLDGLPDPASTAVMRAAFEAGVFIPLQQAADPNVFALAGLKLPDDALADARKATAGLMAAAFTLLLLPVQALVASMRRLWNGPGRLPMLACSMATAGWMGAALWAGWPGMMGWDGFSPYIQHGAGTLTLWYGIGYPLLVSGLLYLGGPQSVVVFQVAICVLLVCWAACHGLERGVPAVLPVLLAVVGLPLGTVALVALTHLRDALNGVLLSGCAVLFYAAFAPRAGRVATPTLLLLAAAALGAALVLLRSDNLAFLAVLLAAAVFLAGPPRWRHGLVAMLVLGSWLAANPAVERVLMPDRQAVEAEKRLYRVTGVINPVMGQLAVGHLPRETAERANHVVDQVMDARRARADWNPFDIVYWHQTYKRYPAESDVQALWGLAVDLVLQDPLAFLRLRLATFLRTLGQVDAAERLAGDVRAAQGYPAPLLYDHLLGRDPHWRRMGALIGLPEPPHANESAARALLEYQNRVASHVPQLIVLAVCAALIRRIPVSGAIAMAGLTRAVVFWAFEPASVFLYLGELQLLGLLLPMLAWAEWRTRRAPSQPGAAPSNEICAGRRATPHRPRSVP